jgi:hypothetical protein
MQAPSTSELIGKFSGPHEVLRDDEFSLRLVNESVEQRCSVVG